MSNAGLYVADLFAGAGGITQGFKDAGFQPVVAVECDRWAAQSYAANFGSHVLACPIEDVHVEAQANGALLWHGRDLDDNEVVYKTPPVDVLVGGPPCQGFSPLGRMTDWSREDPRNKLWRHYGRILKAVRPKVFVIENVPELLRSSEYEALRRWLRREFDGEYELHEEVLNAAHYRVPQVRRRAIVVGSRIGTPSRFVPSLERLVVRDAIGDLPLKPDGTNWHLRRNPTATSVERYKCVPPGGNRFDLMRKRPDITPRCWMKKLTGSTDVFGRMEWDKPAPTIRTEFFKPEKGRYLHPQAHRPITIREAARLQTFPDAFVFVGAAVQAAKQIGNAVPVRMAEQIARHLRATLFSRQKSRKLAVQQSGPRRAVR